MLTQYERNMIAQITCDIQNRTVTKHKRNSDYLIMWNELSEAAKAETPNERQKEMLECANQFKKLF